MGLCFAIHDENIKTDEVEEYIPDVRRKVRKPLIVIMDRLPAHRSAAKRLMGDGFEIEWLPGYAPDLNSTEALWSQTKYSDMANFVPDDTLDWRLRSRLPWKPLKENLLSDFHST